MPSPRPSPDQVLAAVLPGARTAAALPAGKHEVGAKLRKARKERGLTLQQVAESSGLAVSTISKAERGQIALSYEKVLMLGSALDIDMTRLFMVGDAQAAAGSTPTVVKDRFEDVQRYETDQYLYSVLCGAFPGKKMQPLVAVIHAREAGDFSETIRHPGQEFVRVLSGRERNLYENGESVELGRHEAAYFDSGVGHVYVSLSRQPAQVVSVCS
jgi:transcriptional regulator with XRE-family HTH domain